MFGFFKKRCPICKMEVDKEKSIQSLGKYFCSEEHAREYKKRVEDQWMQTRSRGGGCCH